jgi:site-specific recombinase XerD
MSGELVKTANVAEFMRASKAKNTQIAYASDLRHFAAWCCKNENESLPALPETVATYLAALAATHKFATIRRRAAALAFAHRSAGADNPLSHQGVKAVLEGIARTLGSAPVKKAALTAELLAKAVRKIAVERRARLKRGSKGVQSQDFAENPQNEALNQAKPYLTGLRDRALLLLGFAAALRRSELVALNVNDVARHAKGALIIIGRSKTDQTGQGLTKAVPHGKKLKAIEALDAWLIAARIIEGPIFRAVHGSTVLERRLTAGQVARIVKKRCAAIGLDPALFSGHSLRSGFITSAAEAGASLSKIADQAGHAKLDTTREYVQVADAFRDHSGRKFL